MQIGIGLSMTRMRQVSGTTPFNPAALFSDGEQGIWLDPADRSTLFQDTGGTMPVTSDGDPLRLSLDKSGNGNHVTWQNAIYRTDGTLHRIVFNGSSTFGQTLPIDFTSTDEIMVVARVRKLSDAAIGMVAELGPAWGANNGAFSIQAPFNTTTQRYGAGSRGTINSTVEGAPSRTAPSTDTITGLFKISTDRNSIRVNTNDTTSNTDQGSGNYGNYVLNIGARNGSSLWFNGHLYGLLIRGKLPTDAELTGAET